MLPWKCLVLRIIKNLAILAKNEHIEKLPGTWNCTSWDEEWITEDLTRDGSVLKITYEYLPACKCIYPDVGKAQVLGLLM